MNLPASVWVEVRRDALAHNFRAVQKLVGESVKVLAVVKANAYGHGAVESAKAFLEAGAWGLGVTHLQEAVELRDAGITAPILAFEPFLPDEAEWAVRCGLTATIASIEEAEWLNEAAQKAGQGLAVHLKIDTGMGRLGALPEDALALAEAVAGMPALKLSGIYSHFAAAYRADKRLALRQFERFQAVTGQLEGAGLAVGLRHIANSAAICDLPETYLDMVRAGTILYGQYPSSEVSRRCPLEPTWQLKTRIVFIKEVPPGWTVGYGGEFRALRRTRVGILPVGLAEGLGIEPVSLYAGKQGWIRLLARLTGKARPPGVTIRGQWTPLIGRVAMQMSAVDITDLPGAAVGDEALLSARRITTPPSIPRIYLYSADPAKS
ncbi:MAG: alanine racemase [Armatimonadetes bacterium]|nr:alanine racemase [Armatimonadota bacterium]